MMKKLSEFEGKKVKIVDIDGNIFIGTVCDYCEAEDNSPNFEEDSITLYHPTKNESFKYSAPVCFNNSEILKIEVLK